MEACDLIQKITEIFIRERSLIVRMLDVNDQTCFAWINDRDYPETMNLNPNFKHWDRLTHLSLEQILTSAITHEDLHSILYRFGGKNLSDALHFIAGTISKSQFFVDGDWKWIKKVS